MINSKIYLFDYEGKKLIEEEIINENIYNPNLTPIDFNNEDNNYYYIVEYFIFSSGSYRLKLLFYKINLFEKSNNIIRQMVIDKVESSSFFSTKTYYFQNMGLSCEYMQAENEEQHNFLVCFYILKKDSTFYLSQNFLSIDTGSLSTSDKYDPVLDEEISSVKLLQTVVNNNTNIL